MDLVAADVSPTSVLHRRSGDQTRTGWNCGQ